MGSNGSPGFPGQKGKINKVLILKITLKLYNFKNFQIKR
jgi:hypothetical protein